MVEIIGIPPSAAAIRQEAAAGWRRDGHHTGMTVAETIAPGALPAGEARLILHSTRRPVSLTATEFAAYARRVAGALRALGVAAGDVVALQLPGCYEGYLAMVATLASGAVTLPLVPGHGPSETSFILAQARASVLIVPEVWRGASYVDTLGELGDLPNLNVVVVVGTPRRPRDIAWAALEGVADEGKGFPGAARGSDPCAMLYTSGTTAEPKGVVHTHDSLLAAARVEGVLPGHGLRAPGMGHIGGILLALGPLVTGRTRVSMEKWDPQIAARLIAQYAVRTLSGAPILYRTILEEASEGDLAPLEELLLGGTNITPAEVLNAARHGVRACRSYGSTEHPLACRTFPEDDLDVRVNSDGRILAGGRIAILGEDGAPLASGTAGEIALMGPQQFAGYLDPALNATHFHPDGWYLTGDVGVLDGDARLVVTGRKKDIVIRGGENVSAREVEDLLATMPGVEEVAVVGVPDDRYGERVCAFIRTSTAAAPDLEAIQRRFIDAGVAKFKIPESVVQVDDFPRTASGKIQKYVLRDRITGDGNGPGSVGRSGRRL